MLFNSFEFILFFLPLSYFCFWRTLSSFGSTPALYVLLVASLCFYGWWNPAYVALLLASIGFNFALSKTLIETVEQKFRKVFLVSGVTLNLLILGYFKYNNFFIVNINAVFATDYSLVQLVLPLAISFFTFQQIAFLVDCYRKRVQEIELLRYAVFVSFFPQLIAGPIVHHTEIFPQLKRLETTKHSSENLPCGLFQFAIGLFKKVVIADTLAHFVNPMFAADSASLGFTALDYSVGIVCFSLQIYFDFSAYSDMALGLGRMFGIQLPDNFNSPYKANSIIDFWRRWHLTLSRFLKNYLYIPLGGNQRGIARRYINLMLTMLLGGLWHGANWQFVIWGGLHGIYLSINHGFRVARSTQPNRVSTAKSRYGLKVLSASLTLFCVMLAWVFFRAETLSQALVILTTLTDVDDYYFSPALRFVIAGSPLNLWFSALSPFSLVFFVLLLGVWVRFLPNCQEFIEATSSAALVRTFQQWGSNNPQTFGVLVSLMVVFSLLNFGAFGEFIYFQF